MKIKKVDVTRVNVPFRERPGKYMRAINWANFHAWTVFDIFQVETEDGAKGYGDMMPYYTWSTEGRKQAERVIGKNPMELLWDDSVGAGLQMALFDLVGKVLDVPCYRLFGVKVRNKCPVGWWAPDMSGEDWAEEAREAVKSGYTSLKVKARPWYDVIDQIQTVSKVVPPYFKIDADFNDLLVNATHAVPIIQELQRLQNVAIVETPIPQIDVRGYKQIHSRVSCPIATHYADPASEQYAHATTVLYEDISDAFVIGGGISRIVKSAAVVATFNKPFWLQIVGSGLSTAFALHLEAVLSHATLPTITCTMIYQDDLVKEQFEAKGGYISVPEKPGLGVEVDEEAIDQFRVSPDYAPRPSNRLCFVRADGTSTCYNQAIDLYNDFRNGNQPLCERGAKLEIY